MKSFKLNDSHDLDIQNGIVQLAEGSELTRQKIETVLNTKIGEWFFNPDYGIDMDSILGKKKYVSQNNEQVETYIKQLNAERESTEEIARKLARRLDGKT